MEENILSVRIETESGKTRSDLEEAVRLAGCRVIDGPAGVSAVGKSPLDILIAEIDGGPKRELDAVEEALASGAAKAAFLTGKKADQGVLMRAMRMGVREFFPQPIDKEEVKQAVLRFAASEKRNGRQDSGQSRVIPVFGSKGGVGTTTVSVNLAMALATHVPNSRVALVDLKLLFGEVPLFLDLKPRFSWGDLVRSLDRLDNTYMMSVFSRHSSGLRVLAGPQGLNGNALEAPDAMVKILKFMKSAFDFIVVDAGNSLEDVALSALRLADLVCAVAELNVPSIVNLGRLLGVFRKLGYPRESVVKVVINRRSKGPYINIADAEKTIGKKISWFLPNDYQANSSAMNQGIPVFTAGQKSDIKEGFKKMALAIVEETGKTSAAPLK